MKNLLLFLMATLLICAGNLHAQDPESVPESQEASEPEDERQRRGVRRLGDVVGEGSDEWSMDIPSIDMPAQPVEPQPEVNLPDPEQDALLQNLLTRRAFVPDDPDIQAALESLMDQVGADARAALNAGNLEQAQQLVSVMAEFTPNRAVIRDVRAEITRRASVSQTLSEADAALAAGRLVTPPGQSAADLYQQVLALEAGNAAAQAGLDNTQQALIAEAVELGQELDFEGAEGLLLRAEDVFDAPDRIEQARASIGEFRAEYSSELDRQVVQNIDQGNYDQAEAGITQLVALGHDRERVDALRSSLADARVYGGFEPGQVFSDTISRLNREGPNMVVIPAGSFMMGSPDNESDRFSNEGPRHRVTFERGFALSRTEVSVGDFAAFVRDTGYRTDAERTGNSRVYDLRTGRMDRQNNITWRNDYVGDPADDELPVIHVSWNDAQAYARWLRQQTGRNYRLPSEAEFEYALRAGSQTRFWWGDGSPGNVVENLTGDGDSSPTNARWNIAFRRYSDGYWGPAPTGSFEPNPFGLYDMAGNVMEWTEDCWHDSFVRAPGDGSAWVNPGCERRVIKGGSWSSTPAMSRSAFRLSSTPNSTDMRVGFRVARDL
ncbi:MAG: formylglycine-generating enzyme family protein [Wenzhouxiangella sp.]|nr:MAG: formylglycine-generating enzyme family protein [Wenzhouxiangella sp.]